MVLKNKHLWFGLYGIYLMILTCVLLISTALYFRYTAYMLYRMSVENTVVVISGSRIFYCFRQIMTMALALMFIYLIYIAIRCCLITPEYKHVRILFRLTGLIQVALLLRDIFLRVDLSTFFFVPHTIFAALFAIHWARYLEELSDGESSPERKWFPLLREFAKIRLREN